MKRDIERRRTPWLGLRTILLVVIKLFSSTINVSLARTGSIGREASALSLPFKHLSNDGCPRGPDLDFKAREAPGYRMGWSCLNAHIKSSKTKP